MLLLLLLQDITERKTLEMASRMCVAAKAASAARTQQEPQLLTYADVC